jgi:hypothetical protein
VLGGAQVFMDNFLLADSMEWHWLGKNMSSKVKSKFFIGAKNCFKFFKVYFGLDRVEVVGFVYGLRMIFVFINNYLSCSQNKKACKSYDLQAFALI